ncbi:CRISPR-associated endonuclease Cas1 [Thermogemmatispora sp.]|uniref:CRISPR-associated endonuclease Cas1 n=1 Tax=Thermogemmatispora sp. TaxID=1968838 RepID=UPI001DF47E33|nr:CRISPR-associated endonuclease Cas1 [Thermogemmatispora sp.]MBX5450883.1 CRISPR-associated endonuclease Cas1 [Thermogemmatispora sp.]
MNLIVEGKGIFISKHQGRIRLVRGSQVVEEVPLIHLNQILVIDTGVGISSDVVKLCSEEGIALHFLEKNGMVRASLYAAGLTGTVLTRRAQLLAFSSAKGCELALAFTRGKLANQIHLLRYFMRSRKDEQPQLCQKLHQSAQAIQDLLGEMDGLTIKRQGVEELRPSLLSLEGRAAQHYWAGIRYVLPEQIDWPGRQTRGATDLFNALLNYGYGVLYAQVEQAILLAGLDPYAGFLHADRPGKPSLVLDLIEEFRQCTVDRTLVGLLNRRVPLEQDSEGLLTAETRRKVAEKVLERLSGSSELYEGKRQALRFILQQQARHLASFLRGDRETYTPFVAGW